MNNELSFIDKSSLGHLVLLHFPYYNQTVGMSDFLDWILELVKILTGSRPVSLSQKSDLSKENININVNISYPHKETSKKKEKDIIGTIKIFAGSHPPIGWLPCDGRIVKIREYPDLYTVVGDTFGGNGKTTFALPDLRGRVVVGTGHGNNLTPRDLGQSFGAETVTIDLDHMPLKSSDNFGIQDKRSKEDHVLDNKQQDNRFVMSSMKGRSATNVEEKPLENIQPSLGLNYIICCIGIHPDDLKVCDESN
jgi:microcystin-dependent protein